MTVAKGMQKGKDAPLFIVCAHFTKSHSEQKIEVWKGQAKSISVAMGRAVRTIMKRKNVKGMHHNHVAFSIYRSSVINQQEGEHE